MSNIVHVVEGEASESESEIELGKSPDTLVLQNPSPTTRVCVIVGEAPESDEETSINLSRGDDEQPIFNIASSPQQSPPHTRNQSLLHRKLWENNVTLRATAEALLRHTTELSVSRLSEADKMLLHAQESIRATNASLSIAQARLKQIEAGLDRASCGTALPNVKIR